MINDNRFLIDQEMSLDEWVDHTLAPTADTIYFIISRISRFMNSLELDRGKNNDRCNLERFSECITKHIISLHKAAKVNH